jgi:hypothetical protein
MINRKGGDTHCQKADAMVAYICFIYGGNETFSGCVDRRCTLASGFPFIGWAH